LHGPGRRKAEGINAVTHLLGYLLVFLGGGLGSMLRHAVNQASAFFLGAGFWATLFVNITGSFAMGLIAGWFAFRGKGGGQSLRLFLTTGILGGFTTFWPSRRERETRPDKRPERFRF
jgi:CrcB protein